jgi:pimeloyl-ACP methyl ester carboxylesterase
MQRTLTRVPGKAVSALVLALTATATAPALAYTYNTNAASPGDAVQVLSSSAYGGAGSFDAVLRANPGAEVGVVLLHGRGESYLDGHVILPLRLALSAAGLSTISVDTALPQVNNSYPFPLQPKAYANFQYDINSGPNYVLPETFARVRAAEDILKANGATAVVVVGFSMGSRMGANFMSNPANNGSLPLLGYVGVGMGSDGVAAPLDAPTSLKTVKAPLLDLYSSADDPDVFNDAALRQSNYGGSLDTQVQQNMAPTYTVAGTGHQWVTFEPQLISLTQSWLATLPAAPVPEPAPAALMLLGLAALGFRARSGAQ